MAKRWYAQPLIDRFHSGVWWFYWIVSWILLCSCYELWIMNLDSFGNVAKMGWIESESQSAKMNLGESWIVVRVGSYMSALVSMRWYICLIVQLSSKTLKLQLLGSIRQSKKFIDADITWSSNSINWQASASLVCKKIQFTGSVCIEDKSLKKP